MVTEISFLCIFGAERQVSAAGQSGSEERADAVPSRLQTIVRQSLGQRLCLLLGFPAFFLRVLWTQRFSARQRARLGGPLLLLSVTPRAPDAVLAGRDNGPPVSVDHG